MMGMSGGREKQNVAEFSIISGMFYDIFEMGKRENIFCDSTVICYIYLWDK